MKRMTSLSITLMIPTLIASFYGMNVDIHLEEMPYALCTDYPVLRRAVDISVYRIPENQVVSNSSDCNSSSSKSPFTSGDIKSSLSFLRPEFKVGDDRLHTIRFLFDREY